MLKTRLLASVFLLTLAAFRPAMAGELGVGVVFSEDEVKIISAWYRDHEGHYAHEDHGAKPGKTGKSKGLPPGIAKNLDRGKPLPPGIAKQQLPTGLIASLPPVHSGYERVIIDGRVVLVEIATQVIHDVLMDVVHR
jgi:hypothetical protein